MKRIRFFTYHSIISLLLKRLQKCFFFFRLISVLCIPFCFNTSSASAQETYPIVFGFSQSILGVNININDATAAVHTWTTSLTQAANIPADPKPVVFDTLRDMQEAAKNRSADIFYITTPELYTIVNQMAADAALIPVTNGTISEEYILLVNKSSQFTSVKDLQGKDLIIFSNSRTSVAPYWLESEMVNAGFPHHESFFSSVKKVSKLNDAVLPVFFKKSAACLVSKSGFETLAELNPQISKQLTIVLQSPEYVPSGLFFRIDYDTPLKDMIIQDLEQWVDSPDGRQLLTIFQLDSLIIQDTRCLNNTLELLIKHYHDQNSAGSARLHD